MAVKRKANKSSRPRTAARRAPAKPVKRSSIEGLTLTTVSPMLTVNDLQGSLAWYTDVLGFQISDRWEQDGKLMGAEIAAGPTKFWVNQDDWKKGRDRVKGIGVRIFCMTTTDVDRLAERIKSKGGTLTHGPSDEFGMRSISLDDPDGYKITISKNLK